jgi:hypothetical protein
MVAQWGSRYHLDIDDHQCVTSRGCDGVDNDYSSQIILEGGCRPWTWTSSAQQRCRGNHTKEARTRTGVIQLKAKPISFDCRCSVYKGTGAGLQTDSKSYSIF